MFRKFTVAMGSVEGSKRADQRRLALGLTQSEEAGERGDGPAAEPAVDGNAPQPAPPAQRIKRALQASDRMIGDFHRAIITK